MLRFYPAAWHASAQRLPAMVALVQGGRGFAVHRTYLRPDGSGKAEIEPAKTMLGAVAGGAVRLFDAGPGAALIVSEGIETALSALLLRGDPRVGVWAALSTSGMTGLHLPPQPSRLSVALDHDPAGTAAAHALAERAHALGWQVSTARLPAGADWNDVLTGKAVAA